jgi:hypothetical protein
MDTDRVDCLLAVGRTWADDNGSLRVTPVSSGGSSPYEYIDVEVSVADGKPFQFYTDTNRTTRGLVGSYVNASLAAVSTQVDWRVTEAISGSRTDANLAFTTNGWGTRAELGLTSGTDDNWDYYSVQWDGVIEIKSPCSLATVSDNGSRMWIDINKNGQFATSGIELANNYWGVGQLDARGDFSGGIATGVYPVRIQFEESYGNNTFWISAHARPFEFFTDSGGLTNGLIGSYVNSNLSQRATQDDWRVSLPVAGTRKDVYPGFYQSIFGSLSSLGLTTGSDSDWNEFSIQWDGWIRVRTTQNLWTYSDDCSRWWIDLDGNGTFGTNLPELGNNHWFNGQPITHGDVISNVAPGYYRTRIQYVDGFGGNEIYAYGANTTPADDHGDAFLQATILDGASNSIAGNIWAASDNDYYTIEVTNFGRLTAWSQGSLDTYGALFNSAGTSLLENNNNPTNSNFQIVYTNILPGIYYVRVHSFAGATGSYTFLYFVTPIPPVLVVNPSSIVATVDSSQTDFSIPFTVQNSVTGSIMPYALSSAPSWAYLTSTGGVSTGEVDSISLTGTASSLSFGANFATITVASAVGTATVPVQITLFDAQYVVVRSALGVATNDPMTFAGALRQATNYTLSHLGFDLAAMGTNRIAMSGTTAVASNIARVVIDSPPSVVQWTNLVGLWRFDITNGTLVQDLSGFGRSAVVTAPAKLTAFGADRIGQGGKAFDTGGSGGSTGSAGFATAPWSNAPSLAPASFTVAAWVKLGSTSTFSGIAGPCTGNVGFALYVTNGGRFGLKVGAGTIASPSSYPTGAWYHVAGVNDASVPLSRLYVNGAQVGSKVIVGNTNGQPAVQFGALNGFKLEGQVDDVMIWNTNLAASEISSLLTAPPYAGRHGVVGVTVDGAFASRLLDVKGASALDIRNLTLEKGSNVLGGIARVQAGAVLSFTNCTIAGGRAAAGAGLYVSNAAVYISCSTLASNWADGDGGAIFAADGAQIDIRHSTIFGNIHNGIAITNTASVTIYHTLFQQNAFGDAIGTVQSLGYNIFESTFSLTIVGVTNGNLLGVQAGVSPYLRENGGPTRTHALLWNSPALDGGDAAISSPPATDQRGSARIANGVIDIGAYEHDPADLYGTTNDLDGDQLGDYWETFYGLDPSSTNDATADTDGDGVNNRSEYGAHTVPGDASSLLEIISLVGSNLVWQSVSGLTYDVQVTTNFQSWSTLPADTNAVGGTTIFPLARTNGTESFRVIPSP